ncbi:MAG: MFS transporter [Verrucomicrobiaceae bacterium]|nr:MAG: MFS transporter [Verrucomicrobiaceae bacterium]
MNLYPIKIQFFLSYAALGSIGPLMALLLKEAKDFSPRQIALTLSISSIGMLFTPALMTYLADKSIDSRRILRFIFSITAGSLIAVYYLNDPLHVTISWTIYSIAFIPTLPLLDGYFFNHNQHLKERGEKGLEYQKIRIWGSIGFIAPSAILFFTLSGEKSIANSLWCAVTFCILSLLATYLMQEPASSEKVTVKKPTREAFRVLLSPKLIPFCIGIFFSYTAANCYYPYLSVFFKESIGIQNNHIAAITSIGVAIEIIYLLNLTNLKKILGFRGVMTLGLFSMAVRLSILATFPTLKTALIIQIFHGLEILSMFVLPIMYLDQVSGPGFRNSIQGAFTILITVPSRLLGFVIAGEIARSYGAKEVIYAGSILSALGMLIIFVFLKKDNKPENSH